MSKPDSILAGAGRIIDDELRVISKGTREPYYQNMDACKKCVKPDGFHASRLISNLYKCIEQNRKGHRRCVPPSKQNWRWTSHVAHTTKSKEVERERWMIEAHLNTLRKGDAPRWANQIPVASGLLNPSADKRMAIDLAHRCEAPEHKGETCYALVELKLDVKSGTPLHAAFEILQYGLLFVFSRSKRRSFEYDGVRQPLLTADRIHLRVLAPVEYYRCCKLDWLERELSQAIGRFARKEADVGMDFSFWQCKQGDWLKYWKKGTLVYGRNVTRL
ncbi:MAG TPA: hypothetical protein VGC99_24730 [Candidatus Tectomicrobia bacterium]